MNKIYKVIWSKAKNMWVVASELAKSHTKSPKSGIVGYASLASLESKINMDLSKGFVAGVFPVVNTPAVKSSDFKITVAAIVKNEAENVPTWIQAARSCADEIVVVDTGSTDGTVERFADYGIKCFHYDWNDDFASAKNYMISLCHGDWIVLLDGDEWFREGCDVRKAIAKHHANPITKAIIADWICLDKDRNNAVMFSGGAVRAFRNQPDVRYFRRVHENLTIGYENFAFEPEFKMYHTGYSGSVNRSKHERNLRIMRTMFDFDNGKVEYPTDWRYIEDTYAGLGQFDKALWAADKMILYGVQEYSAAAWITKFNVLFAMKTPLTEMKKQFEYCFQTVPSVSGFRFLASIYYFRNGQIEAGLDNYIEGLRMLMGPQDKVAMEHTYWRMYMPEASALASAVYLRNKQIEASLYACKVCEQYCGQTDWTNGALADVRLVMNQTEEGLLGNISERVLPVLQFGKKVVLATAIASSLTVGMVGVANPVYAACCNLNGDSDNYTTGQNSTVTGGRGNEASGNASSVSGGQCNIASCGSSSVSGGRGNEASGGYSSVSGGSLNEANGDNSTVSGGGSNKASGNSSTVSGGSENEASGGYSSVSGGSLNEANGDNSTVSGGFHNLASGDASTVSGGSENEAIGTGSSVFGGWNGKAYATYSTVIGGGVAGVLNPNFNPDNSDDSGWSTNPQNYQYLGIGSVAIGKCATTTRDYEIAIGSACAPVKIDGALTVDGAKTVTDGTTTKTWTELLNASGGSNGGGSIPYIGICSTTGFDNENGDGAVGPDSIAIGACASTLAAACYSIAFGTCAQASCARSVAIGNCSRTNGANAVAIGSCSLATCNSVSIGYCTYGNYSDSVSVGYHVTNAAQYAVAVGAGISNSARESVVLGSCVTNVGNFSIVIGANASNYNGPYSSGSQSESIVIGVGSSNLSSTRSTLIGHHSTIGSSSCSNGGCYNSLIGACSSMTGGYNVGIGSCLSVTGYCNVAIGQCSKASGSMFSTALGAQAFATCSSAVAIGSGAYASAGSSVALGSGSAAAVCNVISVGHKSTDLDKSGTAFGNTYNRRIINVADGIDDTDVVTVGQLNTAIANAGGGSPCFADGEVLAGCTNTAGGCYSSVSGGWCNAASGCYSSVLGGCDNYAIGNSSSVLGGCSNVSYGDSSLSGGGRFNSACGHFSTVIGGEENESKSSADASVVLGGYRNKTTKESSVVVGGSENNANATNSFIAGGYNNNTNTGSSSSIVGGVMNSAKGSYSAIFGGCNAKAYANYSIVIGGGITGNAECATTALGSVAIGQCATTTQDYEIAIGSVCAPVTIGGDLTVSSKIHGVTAGTADTDAVNVKQLNEALADASTPYVGVNIESGSDNEDGGGASGTDAIAIGKGALASGTQSISIGTGNQVTGNHSGAFGDPNVVNGDNSYIVGNNSRVEANIDNAFVFGNNVNVNNGLPDNWDEMTDTQKEDWAAALTSDKKGSGVVALGNNISASLDNKSATNRHGEGTAVLQHSVAIGDSAVTGEENTVALGYQAQATALNATAIGEAAEATAEGTNAIGHGAVASDHFANALGYAAQATKEGAGAFGQGAEATGKFATAFGRLTKAEAESATAIGNSADAMSQSSIAIGNSAIANGGGNANAVAIGRAASVGDATHGYGEAVAIGGGSSVQNTYGTALGSTSSVTGQSGTALGYCASVTATNAVALGAGSVASEANTVSVGKAAAGEDPQVTRKIVNVTDGTTATDAATVGQTIELENGTNSVATADGTNSIGQAKYKIDVAGNGTVASGNTGLVSGGTLFTEGRVSSNGNYVQASNTIAQNLSALDTQVKTNTDAISSEATTRSTADTALGTRIDETITGLSVNGQTITYTKGDGTTGTITTQDTNTEYTAGNGLQLNGTEFSVKAGNNISVTSSGINVSADGVIAKDNTGLVTGGTVWNALNSGRSTTGTIPSTSYAFTGTNNTVTAENSVIIGGRNNTASGCLPYNYIIGGCGNTITQPAETDADDGYNIIINSACSTINGADYSTVIGGNHNTVTSDNVIVMGTYNTVNRGVDGAIISGHNNTIGDSDGNYDTAVIVSGCYNTIGNNTYAQIFGSNNTVADNSTGFIYGRLNRVGGSGRAYIFGVCNSSEGMDDIILGKQNTFGSASDSNVVVGNSNHLEYASNNLIFGQSNYATGDYEPLISDSLIVGNSNAFEGENYENDVRGSYNIFGGFASCNYVAGCNNTFGEDTSSNVVFGTCNTIADCATTVYVAGNCNTVGNSFDIDVIGSCNTVRDISMGQSVIIGKNNTIGSTEPWHEHYEMVAIGYGSDVRADHATAINGTVGNDAYGGVTIYGTVSNEYGVAISDYSVASGCNAIAIGTQAVAANDNALALGSASVTHSDNSVSFGHLATDLDNDNQPYGTALKRRLTMVADGVDASDVATVGQLNSQRIDYVGVNAQFEEWTDATANAIREKYGVETQEEYEALIETGLNKTGQGAIGDNAIALGVGAVAGNANSTGLAGANTIAIGTNAIAQSYQDIAIGDNASTVGSGNKAIAIGNNTKAMGSYGVAIGYDAKAEKIGSLAIGKGTQSTHEESFAIGYDAKAQAGAAIAMGVDTISSGSSAVGIGQCATATGNDSVAIGYKAHTETDETIAIGYCAIATCGQAIAIGNSAKGINNGGVGIGFLATASGYQSTALGQSSLASCSYASALGNASKAVNVGAVAVGDNAVSAGNYSVSIGGCSVASGNRAVAIGGCYALSTQAIGEDSVSIGTSARANVGNSVALGSNSVANVSDVLSLGKDAVGTQGQEGYIPEYTRTIQHVTAGVNDTDAVNVKQLNDSKTKYVGINVTWKAWNRLTAEEKEFYGVTTEDEYNALITNGGNIDGSGAVGADAIAIGRNAKTENTSSNIAVGADSYADGENSSVFGTNARADAQGTAIGQGTSASLGSVALGVGAVADGTEGSIAIGPFAGSHSSDSVAIGTYTNVYDGIGIGNSVQVESGTAIGHGSSASCDSVALGASSEATGYYSTALGNSAEVSGDYAISIGSCANAVGNDSIILGHDSYDGTGGYNVVVGSGSHVSDNHNNSIAIGSCVEVSNTKSVAIGYHTKAQQTDSTAIGSCANASGCYSIALGFNTVTSGSQSVALGSTALAGNTYAVAIGDNVKSVGEYSAAIGQSSMASASKSVALGAWSSAIESDVVSVGHKAGNPMGSSNNSWTSDYTRRIVNVSAGINDTDAVNVKQLNDQRINYVGVDTNWANYDNNTKVRYKVNSEDEYNALKNNSNIDGGGALGVDSIAIGKLAKASGVGAISIGLNNDVRGQDSMALGGRGNTIYRDNGTIIASYNSSIGSADDEYAGWNGLIIGGANNQILSDESTTVIIGGESNIIKGSGSTVVGSFNKVGDGLSGGMIFGSSNNLGYSNTSSGNVYGNIYGSSNKVGLEDYGTSANIYGSSNRVEIANGSYIFGDGNTVRSGDDTTVHGNYNTITGGGNSVFGSCNTITDFSSTVVVGDNNVLENEGYGSLVFGSGNVISPTNPPFEAGNMIAIGTYSEIYAPESIAINGTVDEGSLYSFNVMGHTKDENNIAIGYGSETNGGNSMAFGFASNASCDNSIAFGACSIASSCAAIAIGIDTKATGTNSIAIGTNDLENAGATGIGSTAVGYKSLVTGNYSSAIGYCSTVTGANSIALGTCLTVNGNRSGAIGDPSIVNGDDSYSIGNNNTIATGTCNVFAMGNNISTSASDVVVLGNNSAGEETGTVSLGKSAYTETVHNDQTGEDEEIQHAEITRKIQHVTAGVNDTDAVNVSQLTTGLDEKANVALDNITDAGKTVIQNATNVVSGDSIITVTPTTENGVKTYTVTANVSPDGQIAESNTGLISGGTVYNEVRPSHDGNYITTTNTTGANLTALDTQLKTTTDNLATEIINRTNADTTLSDRIGTVVSDANYIKASSTKNVAENLVLLDTQIKANADAIVNNQTHFFGVNSTGTTDSNYNGGGATGTDAVSIGKNSFASGDASVSMGLFTEASGVNGIAIGSGIFDAKTGAFGDGSVAIGYIASASGDFSVALGSAEVTDSAESAIAIGNGAVVNKDIAIAIGKSANATGIGAIAIGADDNNAGAYATANNAIAVGRQATSNGVDSISLGTCATASSNSSIALGANSVATDNNVLSLGKNAVGTEGQDGYVAEVTRKIQHVTAGTADTDAVNVSQLTSSLGDKADTDLGNITSDGEDVVKALTKGSVNVVGDGKASVSKSDVAGVDTYTVSVTANGTVTENNSDIVTGGTVYNALQQTVSDVNDALDLKANKDASNVSANAVQWGTAIGTGSVAENNGELVTGGTVYTALQAQNTATQTALDDKANVSLDNIDADGQTVVKDLAKEAVKVVAGTKTTVTEGADGTAKTYAVNVTTDGAVAQNNEGIVTGGTVYNALQAQRLDIQTDLVGKANVALDNITTAGHNVIKADAKSVINVVGSGKASVEKTTVTGVDTYTVSVNADGDVAEGNSNIVTGGTVYEAIQNAITGSESGTGIALDGKANVDASNVTDATAWGIKIATGTVAENDVKAISGGTVYTELRPADGNYVAQANTTAQNLTALDTQVKANADAIVSNKTHYFGVNTDNEWDMNYNGGGAEGSNAIAVGSNAWASGDDSIAIGTMSGTYTGKQATAVGYISSAIADKATAVGNMSQAVNVSSVAVGDMAAASGQYSTAIGAYSHAKAKNSISIGSDSYAETEDEVSFGRAAIEANPDIGQTAHDEIKRRLTHVDTGVNDTDAVNVKQLTDAADTKGNVGLDNITTAGHNVIKADAKEAINVTGSGKATVTKSDVSGVDTYNVEVLGNGTVANGNENLVTGGTVYQAIQDAITGSEAGTGTELAGKANKDASNVADNTADWGTAIGTGVVAENNGELVTGGTVYVAINNEATTRANADTALSDRIGTVSTDRNYIKASTDKNVSENLGLLDTAVKTNADAISALTDGKANISLNNINADGETVVKNLAKDAVKVVAGTKTTVTEGTDGDAKTYAVNVATDGAVAQNNEGIVTGGTVYNALQQQQLNTQTELVGKANVALDNITTAGHNVIKEDAKSVINVIGDGNASVDKSTVAGVDTYKVSVTANGAVAENNADIVSGGTVYQAIQNAITGSETGTGTALEGKANVSLDNLNDAGNTVIQQKAIASVKVVNGENTTVTSEIDTDGNKTYKVKTNATGAVANGNESIVSGGTMFTELRPADGNYIAQANTTAQNLTALDTQVKTNTDTISTHTTDITNLKDLSNITEAGQNVIKESAQGSVNVTGTGLANVTKATMGGVDTYTVNVVADGAVASDDAKAVSGATVYGETRVARDGNYVMAGNAANGNIMALDDALKTVSDAVNDGLDGKADTALNNISADGQTVIRDLAKGSVKVVNGTHTTVTEGADGEAKTYAVDVAANGAVADGDTGIVTGNTVYQAIQDAIAGSETGTGTALSGKANVDASNVTDAAAWGVKIATGAVAENDTKAVSGGTVYAALENAKTELNTSITNGLAGKTNVALDNISEAGEGVIKTLAKSSVNLTGSGKASVTKSDVSGVDTYTVNVTADGTVADGDSDIVSGGTVYAALQATQTALQGNIDNKANAGLDNISADGTNVVRTIAKTAVAVADGENTTVSSETDADGNISYKVKANATGTVADGNTGLVDGGSVYAAIQDAVGTSETGTAAGLAGKADVDASNVTDSAAWAGKLGTGAVADGNAELVTGGVVYDALNTAQTALQSNIDGKSSKDLSDITTAGENKVKSLAQNAVRVVAGQHTGVTISASNGALTYAVDVDASGAVEENNAKIVTGGAVYNAVKAEETARANADNALGARIGALAADGNYVRQSDNVSQNLTHLDTQVKANKDALDALSAFDSENAVMYDSTAKDEVTFAGAAGTVLKNVADGTLAENSKEAVNGGQLFAVRQDVAANQDAITALNGLVGTVTDGNYIDSAQSVGVNLGILDARIKSNADRAQANAEAVDALRDLSSLTEAGQGVIAGIAKDAVRVTAGSHVSVTKNTSANESEFVVSVNANGQVADGNTGIVTGGIVKTALDDAKTELQDAIAAMGAGADANAVHYDDDAKTSVSLGDGTAPVALKNIADGSVEENSRDAVTGGQLWQTNQAVANETAAREEAVQGLSDRIGTVDRDGGVISKDKNVSENLTALDAQVKTNTDALAEIRTVAGEAKEVANNKADKDLSGLSDAGKSVVKNIAKEATDVVSSDGSVEIVKSAGAEQNVYQLSVKKDGKVEAGNEDIVTGGVVYDAIKDLKAGSDTFYFGVNNTDENDRNRTGDGASGANAVAVGANVLARGDESVAVGHGSEANGLQSIAIGTGNVVNGDHSGAIGDPNTVNGSGSYVVGNDNTVDGNNTFVMGNNVNAAGSNSVVLGANSDGSQDNVVSVGSVGNERKIVHVADGDIAQDSHDAVTGGQLFNVRKDLQDAQGIDAQKWAEALGTGTVAQGDGNLVTGDTVFTAIRNVNTNNGIIVPDAANNEIRIGGDAAHDGIDYVNIAKSDGSGRVMTGVITDPQDMNSAANVGYVNAIGQNIVNGVSQGFRKMDDKINKVGAGAAAMASLAPLPFDEDQKWNISAAVGTFRGETAGAVGVFYKPQDNVMLNVRGSFGNSENMAGAGVTIGLNKGPAKGLSKVAMAKAMNAQATEIMNQKQQIASQQEQLEAQKAEIAELKKLVQEVVARKR